MTPEEREEIKSIVMEALIEFDFEKQKKEREIKRVLNGWVGDK